MSNTTITVTLDETKANLILAGLGELPAKASVQLILELQAAWAKAKADEEAKRAAADDAA